MSVMQILSSRELLDSHFFEHAFSAILSTKPILNIGGWLNGERLHWT